MNYSIRTKRGESIIYSIVWLVILLMAVFISKSDDGINWARVQHEWLRLLPFAIVFVVHNYLLFPFFFIQNKRFVYFLSTLFLILLAGLFADYIGAFFRNLPGDALRMPTPPPGPLTEMDLHPPMDQRPWHKMFIDNTLVSVLVVGFNSAIKLTVKWQDEERKNKELEKEKLQTELAFLKNQVSPHFFMNTLNNIHALIDINSEDAKQSVIKLSKLMRYLLYDSEKEKTTLAKEIEFIKSYVDLMKLRFTNNISITLGFPTNIPNIVIPPMLFTSLLENAFKHGVSYQQESFIDICMNVEDEFLLFSIKNSKQNRNNGINEPGGIGLENIKKRLTLIYGKKFSFIRNENEKDFEINIKLPINEN